MSNLPELAVIASLRARIAELEGRVQKLIAAREVSAEASATLRDESIAKSERIRELEAGLRLYGSHHTPCPKSPHHDGYDFNQRCTCGLDDLIAANREGEPT